MLCTGLLLATTRAPEPKAKILKNQNKISTTLISLCNFSRWQESILVVTILFVPFRPSLLHTLLVQLQDWGSADLPFRI